MTARNFPLIAERVKDTRALCKSTEAALIEAEKIGRGFEKFYGEAWMSVELDGSIILGAVRTGGQETQAIKKVYPDGRVEVLA